MWGSQRTTTAPPVDERMAADGMASAIANFMKRGTTGNYELLQRSLDAYRLARTAPR